ncbi:unnamed protein product [Arctia plantaginis]|uniref:Uncharacterized protein n=1 Tax=Arctia plantaginis TaxID=874455 RepID=A0A8S0Z747_ARCPL|nr:unnamed protein product [Arctia plantaginis]
MLWEIICLNVIYAIQIIRLLRIFLKNWKNHILGHDKNSIQVLETYEKLIQAYSLYKEIFKTMALFHSASTFCRSLIYIQMHLETENLYTNWRKTIILAIGLTGTVLTLAKNLTLIVLLSLHCEKFYGACEEIERACTIHLMSSDCTGIVQVFDG